MRPLLLCCVSVAVLGGALLMAGCSKKRIEGLSLNEIPAAVAAAFTKADPALRMQAEMVIASVKGNQFLAATSALNDLLAFPGLTADQRRILSQAQISIGARMREMAGDALPDPPVAKSGESKTASAQPAPAAPEEAAAAAAALRIYQRNK